MDYMETVERWLELKETVRKLQDEERALREGLFQGTFPSPDEGVNKAELPDGRILKGTYKIHRSLTDIEDFRKLRLNGDLENQLIRVKHDLVIAAYRRLDSDTRKKVDSVLVIKPGLPTLELVEAKE